ncbi:sensor kinase CitA [Vibrio cholerae]|nr:sensor kinase CitA [Vibrio cholerae]
MVAMVVIQLSLVAGFFHQTLSETLEDQISTKALIQAREIATDPNLIALIQQNRLAEVQAKIDRLQRISDANFIVIAMPMAFASRIRMSKKSAYRCKEETVFAH